MKIKTQNAQKSVIKRKIKFQDYKNYLEAAQTERKINYFWKKKIDEDSLKKDQQELLKNKLILGTQQRFKDARNNVFTEVIDKITNDDEKWWEKKAINWFDRNICIWNKQKLNM